MASALEEQNEIQERTRSEVVLEVEIMASWVTITCNLIDQWFPNFFGATAPVVP
jgi:hypothetical protein